MQRLALIFSALLLSLGSMAQTHDLSVSLRAGAGTYVTSGTDSKGQLRPHLMVDFAYTYFWDMGKYDLGIRTGMDIGYTAWLSQIPVDESFTNVDYLGHQMQYTVTSSGVAEEVRQCAMEIPAMATFRMQGFVASAGLKMMFPLTSHYTQTMEDLSITAYYPDYSVPVRNELITGRLDREKYTLTGRGDAPAVSLLMSVDLGYEWTLDPINRLGLTVYFDGAPCSSFHQQVDAEDARLVDVAPITDSEYPVPDVTLRTIGSTFVTRMNYIDFGVRMYYAFDLGALLHR